MILSTATRLSNDNYNSVSGDSYFSRLFWVKSARFVLVFSWFGLLLSLAPAFGRRGVAAEGLAPAKK
jgi:hypothetical protein